MSDDSEKPSNSSKRRRKRDRFKEIASKVKRMVTEKIHHSKESGSESPYKGQFSDSEREYEPTVPSFRPPICQQPLKLQQDVGLSFSGCGFLGVYHFGVVKCFQRNGKGLINRVRRVSGTSAGSLVAAMFVLAPDEIEQSTNIMYDMADELNTLKFGALSPGFYLGERLVKIVDDHLPQNISKADHRLFVSVTHHKTRENRLISVFPSRDYLIKSLNASCYIPMYSMGINAQPPELDGQPYIDGGYTNNLPDFSDLRTITISPFSSNCDISPADETTTGFDWKMTLGNQYMKVNLRNIVRGAQALFPPSRQTLQHYHDQGYRDAFKFLLANDLLERDPGTSV